MIRQYELIDKILKYNKKADVSLLNRAYVFSMKAHGNQKRASGEAYLTHPLEVASILADLKLDDATIATGLLHDTVEDTLATIEEIEKLFNPEIAQLVDGVTKLSRISFNNKVVEQAENFRKLFLAMSKDIRVLLVKLADRTHNMRTLEFKKKEASRKRTAQETLDIFAPLADRIGLYSVKTELEDLAFKSLHPEEYVRIERRMEFVKTHDDLIPRTLEHLESVIKEQAIEFDLSGREKTIFSIYKKMEKKGLAFDQLTDILAYRVMVKDTVDCYRVLGVIHDAYKAIPGRFKDYISNPKPNGYQSLHTAVIGPYGNRIEVQIRTQEMHEIAESGVAAHWLYKQENDQAVNEGTQYKWLKQLLEVIQSSEDPEEFLENTKLDLFKENVFVFSPSGDIISLPTGATPLDFAYAIHSEVGHKCQSAKVNGRIVPLRTQLHTGDQIEIVTNKAQAPVPGWREIVVSARARTAINRYLRLQERDEQVRLGREIFEKACKREERKVKDSDLAPVLDKYKLENAEEYYAAVGQGRLFPKQAFELIFESEVEEKTEEDSINYAKRKDVSEQESAIGIDGLISGMAVHMAGCCNPVPGESIVGIINTGRGVTIHRKDCNNLNQFEDQPDRWISVKWNEGQLEEVEDRAFLVRLRINMVNQPGSLSELSTAVFNANVNICDFHIERKVTDSFDIRCDVEVKNVENLDHLMKVIRNLPSVNLLERLQG